MGGAITDTATLTAATPPGPAPTGTITFTAFGPRNATCTAPAAYTSSPVTVSGEPATTPPRPAFTPSAPASTYLWIASYSGDANNAPAATA